MYMGVFVHGLLEESQFSLCAITISLLPNNKCLLPWYSVISYIYQQL